MDVVLLKISNIKCNSTFCNFIYIRTRYYDTYIQNKKPNNPIRIIHIVASSLNVGIAVPKSATVEA